MAPDTRLYDDDSDEDFEEGDCILGFEDGPIASTSALILDATTSKLGHRPAFWPCHDSTPASVTCGACSRRSALICQLYIPQDGVEDRHRSLYVFSCLQRDCQRAEGCVRAFSASRYDPELAREAQRAQEATKRKAEAKQKPPGNPFAANPFSSGPSSAANPFAASSDPFVEAKEAEAPPTEQLASLSFERQTSPMETWPAEHPSLPAYYIATSYEGRSTAASQSSNVSIKSVDGGDAGWKNEAYEATAEDERVFLAFQSRIARDDGEGQVVRVGGLPLPFSPGPVEPAAMQCLSCGKHRVFEAQVMPHTIDLLEKGLDADQELGWSIALIWTCPSVACADKTGKGSSWIEEGVRLQFE